MAGFRLRCVMRTDPVLETKLYFFDFGHGFVCGQCLWFIVDFIRLPLLECLEFWWLIKIWHWSKFHLLILLFLLTHRLVFSHLAAWLILLRKIILSDMLWLNCFLRRFSMHACTRFWVLNCWFKLTLNCHISIIFYSINALCHASSSRANIPAVVVSAKFSMACLRVSDYYSSFDFGAHASLNTSFISVHFSICFFVW